jgi:acyl carrier protein
MEDKVKQFISDKLGVSINKFSLDSTIESDFGIAGLDTISFYNEFFAEFEIKVSKDDFNIDEYVTSENPEIWKAITAFFSKSKTRSKVNEVSVRHLIKVAEAKVWSIENK